MDFTTFGNVIIHYHSHDSDQKGGTNGAGNLPSGIVDGITVGDVSIIQSINAPGVNRHIDQSKSNISNSKEDTHKGKGGINVTKPSTAEVIVRIRSPEIASILGPKRSKRYR